MKLDNNMKNILIPTDFSTTSKDAFLYAQAFAASGSNFMLLHSYHPEYDPAFSYLGTSTADFYKKREKELKSFSGEHHQVQQEGNILIDTYVSPILKIGLAGDIIIEESKKDIDFIVMGRTGSNSTFEKVFGTVSTHVAKYAHCPVLLIPEGKKFKGIKKIIFATNKSFVENDLSIIEKLASILVGYYPSIHFTQIQNDIFNHYDLEKDKSSILK